MKIKIISLLLFLACILFITENSLANPNEINPYNSLPLGLNPKPTITSVLCRIKCMMQGNVGLVIVAIAVFTSGMMVLTQKMTWPAAVLTSVLVLVFTQAGSIANYITTSGFFGWFFTFASKVTCICLPNPLDVVPHIDILPIPKP